VVFAEAALFGDGVVTLKWNGSKKDPVNPKMSPNKLPNITKTFEKENI